MSEVTFFDLTYSRKLETSSVRRSEMQESKLLRATLNKAPISAPVSDRSCNGQARSSFRADGRYRCTQAIEHIPGIWAEVVRRPGNRSNGTLHDPQQSLWQEPIKGFVVLPRRWVIERTHAWNERWCRMVMHYEPTHLSLRPGSGLREHVLYSTEWPRPVDFVHTLLAVHLECDAVVFLREGDEAHIKLRKLAPPHADGAFRER